MALVTLDTQMQLGKGHRGPFADLLLRVPSSKQQAEREERKSKRGSLGRTAHRKYYALQTYTVSSK